MNSRVLSALGIVFLAVGVYFAVQTFYSPQTDAPPQAVAGDGVVAEGGEKRAPEQLLSSIERTVPAFELPSIDNTLWTVDTLQGKPWVINFWATWCTPCIEEIPSMNAAFEVLEPLGIGMLAINAGEGTEAVEEFLAKIAIDFPNILGNADTLPNWSVKALPTTIVVNADGDIVYEALGPREWDDEQLLQQVVELL